jgi:HEAT repeat protein
LLAQRDIDATDVREALLTAAQDENEYVRAEAILGLAERDHPLALPLLRWELSNERIAVPLFEAAALVPTVRLWTTSAISPSLVRLFGIRPPTPPELR